MKTSPMLLAVGAKSNLRYPEHIGEVLQRQLGILEITTLGTPQIGLQLNSVEIQMKLSLPRIRRHHPPNSDA